MLAGTVAAPLLLENVTNTPPDPAGRLRCTVPVALCPADTVDGLRLTLVIVPAPGPLPLDG